MSITTHNDDETQPMLSKRELRSRRAAVKAATAEKLKGAKREARAGITEATTEEELIANKIQYLRDRGVAVHRDEE